MRGRELLQRTPVRLAATFSLLFIVTFFALFGVLYAGIQARLESDIRHRVEETSSAIAAFDDPVNNSDIVSIVEKESASVRDSDFIFALIDAKGNRLAGNVNAPTPFSGLRWIKRENVNFIVDKESSGDAFLALWRPLAKGQLLVGLGNREIRQMGKYLLSVLSYGLVGAGIVIVLVSIYLASAAQRRINVFSRTLAAISNGQITARVPMSGSGDDIDQVALQVNRALAKLQTLIENVNQSSSDIAHDLKRPIARIRQRLDETILESDPNQIQRAIQEAITDLDTITRTFDALLNITQIEAGARRARFARVDLERIVDDVFEMYAPVAEDAGHSLLPVSKTGEGFSVLGDAELLTQLLINLVENSVCHTPDGTTIALRLSRTDSNIVLDVSDSGPGIPADERSNVFRRLYRLERARSTPGSGLGLSLAHAIAELHDASISLADNAPGLRVSVSFAPFPVA